MKNKDDIKATLTQLGVTRYGLLKQESRHLAEFIHDDEQIKGVIYGRNESGTAMLVATDKRVLFLDKRPLYSTLDEITYDVVSGFRFTKDSLFMSATLYTRVGNYTLRYINGKSAKIFEQYLQTHILEHPTRTSEGGDITKSQKITLEVAALTFLKKQNVATLSTIDRTGNVHGAVVYYITLDDACLYILTKAKTQKARDVYAHAQAALTVFDAEKLQTLQLQVSIALEVDGDVRKKVFEKVIKFGKYDANGHHVLPITKLPGDDFIVLKLTPTSAKYSDFTAL